MFVLINYGAHLLACSTNITLILQPIVKHCWVNELKFSALSRRNISYHVLPWARKYCHRFLTSCFFTGTTYRRHKDRHTRAIALMRVNHSLQTISEYGEWAGYNRKAYNSIHATYVRNAFWHHMNIHCHFTVKSAGILTLTR